MIYFIQAGGPGGAIKIGSTARHPTMRLKEITAHTPLPCEIIAVYEGDVWGEKRLHHRFRKHRIKGEWFRPDEEIMAYLATEVQAPMPTFKLRRVISVSQPVYSQLDVMAKEAGITVPTLAVQLLERHIARKKRNPKTNEASDATI